MSNVDQYVKQIIGDLNLQVCVQQARIDELQAQLADVKKHPDEVNKTKNDK